MQDAPMVKDFFLRKPICASIPSMIAKNDYTAVTVILLDFIA
jgi:hypothetical protein